MKRFLQTFILALVAISASALTFVVDGFKYETLSPAADDPHRVICMGWDAGAFPNTSLRIPAEVTYDGITYKVCEIGNNAFMNNNMIVYLSIGYGIQDIGIHAFLGCSNLKTVNIPSSVNRIWNAAFSGCKSLKYVYVAGIQDPPETSDDAFAGCNSEMALRVTPYDGNVEAYRAAMCQGSNYFIRVQENITACDVMLDVSSVGDSAYRSLFAVVKKDSKDVVVTGTPGTVSAINIPRSIDLLGESYYVREIAPRAFKGCSEVTSLTFADGAKLDMIGDEAFRGTSLESVKNLNARKIGESAFYGIRKLTEVEFGPDVEAIGTNAFCDCRIANDVILPYGLRGIYGAAFYNNSFKRILIPSSVYAVALNFLAKNSHLEEIILNKSSYANYDSWDLTGVPTSCRLLVPVNDVEQYKNHSEWGKLQVQAGAYDFNYGEAFNPNSVYHMTVTSSQPVTHEGDTYDGTAKYVFHPNIQSADGFLPSHREINAMLGGDKRYLITEIGDSCFSHTSTEWTDSMDLTGLTALQRIGHDAFWLSYFKVVKLPASVTRMDEYAFFNMPNLTDFYVENPDPVSIEGSYVFYASDQACATLHVPTQAAVAAYQNAPVWKRFNKIVCDNAQTGDINGDGIVNVTDVTALINTILGTASYDDTLCDLNGDGVVNVTDVTALINLILGAN